MSFLAQIQDASFWERLQQWDDKDGFALLLVVMFLLGTPLVLGLAAKLFTWAAIQWARAFRTLQEVREPEEGHTGWCEAENKPVSAAPRRS